VRPIPASCSKKNGLGINAEARPTAPTLQGINRLWRTVCHKVASGARSDRPELARLIEAPQPGDAVIAEKIGRLFRLPLAEAERLIGRIKEKGTKLAIPGIVDLSEFGGVYAQTAEYVMLYIFPGSAYPIFFRLAHKANNGAGCRKTLVCWTKGKSRKCMFWDVYREPMKLPRLRLYLNRYKLCYHG
jgi:hypothetical protein